MTTKDRRLAPIQLEVFFGIDALEEFSEESGIGIPALYGWTAYCVLFGCLDPHRFPGCQFSDGDVLVRGDRATDVIEAFCIGMRFSERSQLHDARDAIDASACPALLSPPRRFAVDRPGSRLVIAGRIDATGRFVVNPDWAYPRKAPPDTPWRLKAGRSR